MWELLVELDRERHKTWENSNRRGILARGKLKKSAGQNTERSTTYTRIDQGEVLTLPSPKALSNCVKLN